VLHFQPTKGEIDFADQPNAVTAKVTRFAVVDNNSLEAILARMIACEGYPISKFRTGAETRKNLEARLQQLQSKDSIPNSDFTIKSRVFSYADKAEMLMKEVRLIFN